MKNIIAFICGFFLSFQLQAAETKITYYVPDAQGSPIAAMDEAGNILWRKHYNPFGEEIEQDAASQDNRIGYTGHVQDRDTGLTYMGARYYDPQTGRFMAMDPAAVNPNDPRTFNRYNYANNNPYRFVDPDGRENFDYVRGAANELISTAKSANQFLSILPVPEFQYVDQGDGVKGEWAVVGASAVAGGAGLVRGGVKAVAKGAGKEIGILRDAAKGKGNFGLGQATTSEAEALGKSWVGPSYRVASDGKTLVSSDGLRTYRPPTSKSSPYATTGVQANFERLEIVKGRPAVISNGHLDITP